ncbi:MAG TPA: hypothetical protein ENH62_05840 [Marinobacter sp.]|nr:hypothetical protein [Marinobacter sp.]
MTNLTITATVLFLVGVAFASGYIVGAAQYSQRPVDGGLMPPCSWAYLQPTPHKPDESWKCKRTGIETHRSLRRDDI